MSENELKSELDRVRKDAAVMREALEHCLTVSSDPPKYGRFLTSGDRDIVRSALNPNVGANYVSKEQVKPLVEALDGIRANLTQWQQLVIATKGSLELLEGGITHARALGL